MLADIFWQAGGPAIIDGFVKCHSYLPVLPPLPTSTTYSVYYYYDYHYLKLDSALSTIAVTSSRSIALLLFLYYGVPVLLIFFYGCDYACDYGYDYIAIAIAMAIAISTTIPANIGISAVVQQYFN